MPTNSAYLTYIKRKVHFFNGILSMHLRIDSSEISTMFLYLGCSVSIVRDMFYPQMIAEVTGDIIAFPTRAKRQGFFQYENLRMNNAVKNMSCESFGNNTCVTVQSSTLPMFCQKFAKTRYPLYDTIWVNIFGSVSVNRKICSMQQHVNNVKHDFYCYLTAWTRGAIWHVCISFIHFSVDLRWFVCSLGEFWDTPTCGHWKADILSPRSFRKHACLPVRVIVITCVVNCNNPLLFFLF